jgi:alpha-ketoglutarate-dependent taurine dioxygenase
MNASIAHSALNFPVIIQAGESDGAGLAAWYERNRSSADAMLNVHGALLFRDFNVSDENRFSRTVRGVAGQLSDYVDGNSPRTKISSGVYTSTEYPPEYAISLHNELSYANQWPLRLFFGCIIPPQSGGETPLADSRRLLGALDKCLVEEFKRRKIKYIRNLHGGAGFGKSWQETFETDDRATVEKYIRDSDTEWRWTPEGGLRLSSIRPPTTHHPRTHEEVWFNQADQFHPSTHPREVFDNLMELYDGDEDALPQNARFGDDTPIPLSALEHIRSTVQAHMVGFTWRMGDLLVVDNILVSHGRLPFSGSRRILVAMAGRCTWTSSETP